MRIAIVFTTHDFTGASRVGREYVLALHATERHEVSVIMPGIAEENAQTSLSQHLVDSDVQVELIRDLEKRSPRALVHFVRKLKHTKPQLVITVNQSAYIYGFASRVIFHARWLHFIQNRLTFSGGRFKRSVKSSLFRLVVGRFTNGVATISQMLTQEMEQELAAPKSHIKTIVNGIEARPRTPNGARQLTLELGLSGCSDPNRFNLITVGRLDKQKDQLLLLRSIASNRELRALVRLFIVGEATNGISQTSRESKVYSETLKEYCEENGLAETVRFLGWRQDIGDLLSVCDCYVHPASWEGGVPLAVVEAMYAELPIIMVRVFSYGQEFEKKLGGKIVEDSDPLKLAEAILVTSKLDAEERYSLGLQNRELAERNFSIDRARNEFVEYVSQLGER